MRKWLTALLRSLWKRGREMRITVRPAHPRHGAEQYVVIIEDSNEEQVAAYVEKRKDNEGIWYYWCFKHRRSHSVNSPFAPPCADIKAIVDGYAWRDTSTGEQRDD